MRNGGELSDLEYLPMKTEYTKYLLRRAKACKSWCEMVHIS